MVWVPNGSIVTGGIKLEEENTKAIEISFYNKYNCNHTNSRGFVVTMYDMHWKMLRLPLYPAYLAFIKCSFA